MLSATVLSMRKLRAYAHRRQQIRHQKKLLDFLLNSHNEFATFQHFLEQAGQANGNLYSRVCQVVEEVAQITGNAAVEAARVEMNLRHVPALAQRHMAAQVEKLPVAPLEIFLVSGRARSPSETAIALGSGALEHEVPAVAPCVSLATPMRITPVLKSLTDQLTGAPDQSEAQSTDDPQAEEQHEHRGEGDKHPPTVVVDAVALEPVATTAGIAILGALSTESAGSEAATVAPDPEGQAMTTATAPMVPTPLTDSPNAQAIVRPVNTATSSVAERRDAVVRSPMAAQFWERRRQSSRRAA
jgi:hypothetical protein